MKITTNNVITFNSKRQIKNGKYQRFNEGYINLIQVKEKGGNIHSRLSHTQWARLIFSYIYLVLKRPA